MTTRTLREIVGRCRAMGHDIDPGTIKHASETTGRLLLANLRPRMPGTQMVLPLTGRPEILGRRRGGK